MVLALLVVGSAAGAADQLVPGSRLGLKVDAAHAREKLTFQSKGLFTIPTPGSADDPSQTGATLTLVNPSTSESFTFDLPSTHWTASGSGTSYRYRDSVPVETGAVRIALVGGRKLKVTGRKVGITLDEPSQGAIAVVLASGSFRYCALFDDGSVYIDQPGRFSARRAVPPAACPGQTTTTSTVTTTSATTTSAGATSTTSTTIVSTSTTTSPGGTSTTTTTATTLPVTTTTATIPLPPLGQVVLTINPGTTNCGGPNFFPPAGPPFSGEVDSASGKVADLGLGCLYVGGPNATSLPPASLADGATSVLDVTGISGLSLTLGGSDGSGPADCTRGAGPARHCINGNTGTDGMGACASDADCGAQADSCALDANCFFGPPLPLANAANPATSTCIVNAIAEDVTGTADLLSGGSTANAALQARIYLTGNATSPCPRCVAGVCTAGPRQGLGCSGGVGTKGTSLECPPDPQQFVGTLPPTLSLNTGTSTLANASGMLCPGQSNPGAFGRFSVRSIHETGAPLLGSLGSPFSTTLAGVFCVPASGSDLVNALADLPGPAAISVPGTISVDVVGLPLP